MRLAEAWRCALYVRLFNSFLVKTGGCLRTRHTPATYPGITRVKVDRTAKRSSLRMHGVHANPSHDSHANPNPHIDPTPSLNTDPDLHLHHAAARAQPALLGEPCQKWSDSGTQPRRCIAAPEVSGHLPASGRNHVNSPATGAQGKLSALAGAVQYQELSDPAVWDACGAMDDCAAILEVLPHVSPSARTSEHVPFVFRTSSTHRKHRSIKTAR